jgi:hypothetical protein
MKNKHLTPKQRWYKAGYDQGYFDCKADILLKFKTIKNYKKVMKK